ncbi:M20 family metallopeptidase, partial [Streptomyces anulatus]|uniref:M20 family metallopeptidase n=1 Tax=Streptomyces anulatus TaxID=1892 RepID=UPI00342E8C74
AAPQEVGPHLLWSNGPTEVLLLGHYDTVWPRGTLARWPFEVAGDRATGPGCFDMKAGVAQIFHALAGQDSLDGVTVLITADEEVGSPSSQGLIETVAREARAALVTEPSADGALKTARKGVAHYTLRIQGRAAHAGLDPELGVNAGVELAHQVLAVTRLGNPARGTTVTPTVSSAGTTSNTVPAAATLSVDVRTAERVELARVDAALRALEPVVPGAALSLRQGPSRPPLEGTASAGLYRLAQRLAADLGQPPLREARVGGGSDGNFTAGIGVPTLDGLGAAGGNAHAEGEWVDLASLPRRTALLAALVRELRERGDHAA